MVKGVKIAQMYKWVICDVIGYWYRRLVGDQLQTVSAAEEQKGKNRQIENRMSRKRLNKLFWAAMYIICIRK